MDFLQCKQERTALAQARKDVDADKQQHEGTQHTVHLEKHLCYVMPLIRDLSSNYIPQFVATRMDQQCSVMLDAPHLCSVHEAPYLTCCFLMWSSVSSHAFTAIYCCSVPFPVLTESDASACVL